MKRKFLEPPDSKDEGGFIVLCSGRMRHLFSSARLPNLKVKMNSIYVTWLISQMEFFWSVI